MQIKRNYLKIKLKIKRYFLRYCINSCSLEFRPANPNSGSGSGSGEVLEENPIQHLATLGGCDGKFCFAKNTTTTTKVTATTRETSTTTHSLTSTTAKMNLKQ